MPADRSADCLEQTAFNFSRAGLVTGDQIRTLRTLDEQFARNLTHTLGAWLRTNVVIAPLPAEQQIFGKFVEATAIGCHVQAMSMRMDPQQARGVLSLSLALAPTIIDLLLGGSGRAGPAGKELTEIEEAVLGSVLDLVLREWSTAWSPFQVEFVAEARERDNHGRRMMPLPERVFSCRFSITLAELTGELLFCLPSSLVISSMRAFAHRRDQHRQHTEEERARMAHRLHAAGLKASLQFPAMRLRAGDLHALQPGSLLPLPLPRDVSAELLVGGVAVFRAEPVRAGEHRAAQVLHALNLNIEEGGTKGE